MKSEDFDVPEMYKPKIREVISGVDRYGYSMGNLDNIGQNVELVIDMVRRGKKSKQDGISDMRKLKVVLKVQKFAPFNGFNLQKDEIPIMKVNKADWNYKELRAVEAKVDVIIAQKIDRSKRFYQELMEQIDSCISRWEQEIKKEELEATKAGSLARYGPNWNKIKV